MMRPSAEADLARLTGALNGLMKAAEAVSAIDIMDWVRCERDGYTGSVPEYRILSGLKISAVEPSYGAAPSKAGLSAGLRHPAVTLAKAAYRASGTRAVLPCHPRQLVDPQPPNTLPAGRFDVLVEAPALRNLTATVERLIADWQAQIATRLLHEARFTVSVAGRMR